MKKADELAEYLNEKGVEIRPEYAIGLLLIDVLEDIHVSLEKLVEASATNYEEDEEQGHTSLSDH